MNRMITRGMTLLGLGWAFLSHAAVEEGSEPKQWPADPARHVVVVKRLPQDEAGAKWVAAAEKVLPDRAALLAASKSVNPEAAPAEKQWWFKEELGIKIPFAITTDAIDYYSAFVTAAGKQAMKRYSEPASELAYEAVVSAHESFELDGKTFAKVSVVTMSLKFRQSFVATPTEGMEFEKRRTVVFDHDGKVLHVSGDGATEAMILAI